MNTYSEKIIQFHMSFCMFKVSGIGHHSAQS